MPYIIYSNTHGPLAYINAPILNVRPQEGEILIPCESGADVGDVERWKAEAAYMEERGTIAPTLETAKEVKTEEIAAARWKAETGGVEVNGITIDTSRESQALITGATLQATLDDTYTCNWKTAQGFITLDAQTILGVAVAVRQHVQAAFNREAELTALIEAAETIEDVQAITWEMS
jgi:predicted secreted protein